MYCKKMIMGANRKTSDTLWAIRGVSQGQDICLVIEAPTETAADCFATKRGIEVVVVTQASAEETAAAKAAGRLWRYTPEAKLKCFGRPIGHLQAAFLVLCGLGTVLLNLHVHHVPLRFH
jgi:hypothetical protein